MAIEANTNQKQSTINKIGDISLYVMIIMMIVALVGMLGYAVYSLF